MTNLKQDTLSVSEILLRIDAIMRELAELRTAVLWQELAPADGKTRELFGALGHGSWDEYDHDLEWLRFSA